MTRTRRPNTNPVTTVSPQGLRAIRGGATTLSDEKVPTQSFSVVLSTRDLLNEVAISSGKIDA